MTNVSECCICFTEVSTSQKIMLECTHEFCIECVKQFRDPSCPCCRAPITASSLEVNGMTAEEIKKMNEKKSQDKQEREGIPPELLQQFREQGGSGGMPSIVVQLLERILRGNSNEASIDVGPFTIRMGIVGGNPSIPRNSPNIPSSPLNNSGTGSNEVPSYRSFVKATMECYNRNMECCNYLLGEIKKNPEGRDMRKDILNIVNACRTTCIVLDFDKKYQATNQLILSILVKELPIIYPQYTRDDIRGLVLDVITEGITEEF
jgi:hypothetical protein